MTEPLPPGSLRPYDLTAPARLLVPGRPHEGRSYSEQSVRFGGEDAAVLIVTTWGKCRPGCRGGGVMSTHEAGVSVRLKVPCDARPHCESCECLGWHEYVLLPDKVAEMKGILP